jgi:hypothetical protein
LSHPLDKGCAPFFISLNCDTFEFLAAHTSSFKFAEDGGIVHRNESILLEQAEKFIKEVVGVVSDKPKKVLDVVSVQNLKTTATGATGTSDKTSLTPKFQDLEPSPFREPTAFQNHFQR